MTIDIFIVGLAALIIIAVLIFALTSENEQEHDRKSR